MSEIMTYTRKMFDPVHPDAERIDIVDIAHALSMLCRANGHFSRFYSVAQHSINCMMEAKTRGYSNRIQLACLLHDASEAYLSDITRPVKAELPRYKEIEAPLQEMIWNQYLDEPLSTQELIQVFEIDDAILAYEFLHLMETRIVDPMPRILSRPEFHFVGFDACEREFLKLFLELTSGEREFFAVGIDWMRPFWLAAEIRGNEIKLERMIHISGLNNDYLNADAVLIDIPIGLPENVEEYALRPDVEARNYLGKDRKSTIFPVPCRQAVGIEDYAEASEENARILGKKLTSQAHAFSKMIRQVDVFLTDDIRWKNRLAESHPEVAFQMLNGGESLQHSKHTEEGMAERIAVLRRYDVDAIPLFAGFKPEQYADVLDAVCLAVSAKLGCQNGFRTIPENPSCDSRGLKMQMVFAAI